MWELPFSRFVKNLRNGFHLISFKVCFGVILSELNFTTERFKLSL
ncbi:hypothetical protein LEP1GSC044_0228 [Leptospira kirschneri serovar Grippotyphosa str. RM52]|nr:hypothetical protein LEP1GSC044_0228 [Leptospira kirschneri serovar Grippotyphosa str. RM52]EMK04857.1 hypothetical protein LEP1GSC176_3717 [Leptospira kirschneri str. MMD1493]